MDRFYHACPGIYGSHSGSLLLETMTCSRMNSPSRPTCHGRSRLHPTYTKHLLRQPVHPMQGHILDNIREPLGLLARGVGSMTPLDEPSARS